MTGAVSFSADSVQLGAGLMHLDEVHFLAGQLDCYSLGIDVRPGPDWVATGQMQRAGRLPYCFRI